MRNFTVTRQVRVTEKLYDEVKELAGTTASSNQVLRTAVIIGMNKVKTNRSKITRGSFTPDEPIFNLTFSCTPHEWLVIEEYAKIMGYATSTTEYLRKALYKGVGLLRKENIYTFFRDEAENLALK